MDIRAQFEQAVADSKTLSEKPDNVTLLKLYSLFKQGSIGDVNTDPPANPFDFIAKAKYDAWAARKGTTQEEAMQAYIKLIQELTG
jgi:acyl-CoA-binding protein